MPSFYYSTRIQKMNFGRRSKVTSSCKWPIIIEGVGAYSVYGGSHVHFGQRQKRTQFRSCLVLRRLSLEVNLRAKKGGREKTGENLLPMVSCMRFDNIDAHFELAFVRDVKNEAPGEEDGSGSIRSCKTT